MTQPHPPRWADRFLSWYCNQELLEEIQGDAHELYFERLERKGKLTADLLYYWDVIRFFRLSNIQRPSEFNEPGFLGLLWNINLKLAIRNAFRNKLVFSIKLSALAICMAFSLLLTALVINDTTYDHHYPDYAQLYRVASHVNFQGKETQAAVSPLPLGPTLAEEVPAIDGYTRFMIMNHPLLIVGDKTFYGITAYAADANFLTQFPQKIVEGTSEALSEPNHIVLTESIAKNIFGSGSALGKSIDLGWTEVEVSAIIRDLPSNTHFTFQALVSWDTFTRRDEWDNINAYTYIHIQPGISPFSLDSAISAIASGYMKPLSENYKFSFNTILQRIDEIHLSEPMDEDFAIKRNRTYIYIMISVIILFLLTGLFNYLNLALTELTLQSKAIAILKAFGGYHANHRKIALTETILTILIAVPIVSAIMILVVSQPALFPAIDKNIWTHPLFVSAVAGIVILALVSSGANGIIAARTIVNTFTLKPIVAPIKTGFSLRKFLVASQLAFSIVMVGLIAVILQQFRFIEQVDKGFKSSHVFVIKRPSASGEHEVFENELRRIPGVQQVSASSFYPDGGQETKNVFEFETTEGQKTMLFNYIHAENEYPELLGMQLVAGRFFDKTTQKRTFIINETAARLLGWPDPIGKSVSLPDQENEESGPIIGIVKDFHFESLHAKIEPLVILSTKGGWNQNYVYIKSNPLIGNTLLRSIDQVHQKLYPDEPFEGDFLEDRYQSLYKNDYELRDIFRHGLIISLLVSALGIFSMSALILSLRNKEMGIRKVVGASNLQLLFMHLKPFGAFFLIAAGIGLPLVFYLSRQWLNNFAYHITLSPVHFLLPVASMSVVILLAAGYHAVKCSSVNPVDILKEE